MLKTKGEKKGRIHKHNTPSHFLEERHLASLCSCSSDRLRNAHYLYDTAFSTPVTAVRARAQSNFPESFHPFPARASSARRFALSVEPSRNFQGGGGEKEREFGNSGFLVDRPKTGENGNPCTICDRKRCCRDYVSMGLRVLFPEIDTDTCHLTM